MARTGDLNRDLAKKMNARSIAILAWTYAALAAILAVTLGLIILTQFNTHTDVSKFGLPACETEDSQNCYWDASTRGNGQGQSFIDLNGTAYYLGR